MSSRYLVDADAFLCLRHLSMLEALATIPFRDLHLTEYIARHELSTIDREVKALEASGILTVHRVVARTPAHKLFKKLKKSGAHKGEAEAMAWAALEAQRPLFVTLDRGATRFANAEQVPVTDVFGLSIVLVKQGILRRETVEEKLSVWEDKKQGFCRPRDFTTLDASWMARTQKRPPYPA